MTFLPSRLGRITCALAVSGVALGAANEGSMVVSVTDSKGAPVAGASVTLTSPTQIGAPKVAVTDASGRARFPRLAPGTFKVVVSAKDFESQTRSGLSVMPDQTLTANLKLSLVGSMSVDVVATSAHVDVSTVTTGTQISAKEIEALPMGRNQLATLALAPGVVDVGGNPSLVTGLNRDNFGGNGARNNTYMLDGIDVTSPEAGTGRTQIAPELVQVQDVKTGAITAEYTARAGLFSNVTIKVGGNDFSGGLVYALQPGSMADKVQAGKFDIGERQQSDFTFYSLGPIIKDKLWYVVSYQAVKDETTVKLSPTAASTPDEKRTGVNEDRKSLLAKLTFQPFANDTLSLTYNTNPYSFDNLSNPGVLTRRAAKTEQGGNRFIAHYAHQWDNVFLDIRWAIHNEDNKALARFADGGPQNTLVSTSALTPLQKQLGNSSAMDEREYKKDLKRIDATWVFDAFGQHSLKGGFQWGTEKLTQTIGIGQGANYESFDVATYTWGTVPPGQIKSQAQRALTAINGNPALKAAFVGAGYVPTGTAGVFALTDLNSYVFSEKNPYGGYYAYRFNQQSIASSSPYMDTQGFYIQDQWQLDKFTFSPGIRFDKYAYKADNGASLFNTPYAFAPRVGLTWDVEGNGRSKAYAYWGRYIDPIKLDMVRFTGSLSSSVRTEDVRMLGQWITVNTRGGTKTIDAVFADTFKLPKTDEFRIGYSRELGSNYTLDLTATRRRDYDIVEDWDPTLYTDAGALEDEARSVFKLGSRQSTPYDQLSSRGKLIVDRYRALVIPFSYFAGGGFTGEQNTARVANHQLNFVLANLPGGERTYSSYDITLNRREADNWGGFASVSFVNTKGNSFSSGNADYQGDLAMYDPRLPYTNGNLDGSINWLAKLYGYYRLPKGFLVSGTLQANSGYNYSRSTLVGTRILQAAPSVDDFDKEMLGNLRSPSFNQIDLHVQYNWKLWGRTTGEVFLDIYNAANRQNATDMAEGLNVRAVAPVADTPWRYQAPRRYMFGFRMKY